MAWKYIQGLGRKRKTRENWTSRNWHKLRSWPSRYIFGWIKSNRSIEKSNSQKVDRNYWSVNRCNKSIK